MASTPPMAALNRTRGTWLASNVRVARTHWTRMRGLIGTTNSDFAPGQALWIVPCRGVHTFAMKFSLDLVYLDREHRVIDLKENLAPWKFAPFHFHATSVMELPIGAIRRSRTEKGDKIEIVTAQQPQDEAA